MLNTYFYSYSDLENLEHTSFKKLGKIEKEGNMLLINSTFHPQLRGYVKRIGNVHRGWVFMNLNDILKEIR